MRGSVRFTRLGAVPLMAASIRDGVQCGSSRNTHSASPLGAALFFVFFVLFGTMIIINLFIGVILNSMEVAREEAKIAKLIEKSSAGLTDSMHDIETAIGDLNEKLKRLQVTMKSDPNVPYQ